MYDLSHSPDSSTVFLSLQAAFVMVFEDAEPSLEVIVSEREGRREGGREGGKRERERGRGKEGGRESGRDKCSVNNFLFITGWRQHQSIRILC